LERDVAEPIYFRDGSGMLALAMHRQNGSILFAVVNLLGFRESSLLPSVGSGFFGNPSTSNCVSVWVLVLIENRWSFEVLGLAASGTRTSSSKGLPGSKLLLLKSSNLMLEPSSGVEG
jgi:hypothetical protein